MFASLYAALDINNSTAPEEAMFLFASAPNFRKQDDLSFYKKKPTFLTPDSFFLLLKKSVFFAL